ncbi:MAG TPA: PAS domain S-box protein, partial [Nitrospiria bacterium]
MNPKHAFRTAWQPYVVAIAIIAAAAALRLWPLQVLGVRLAWLTFYPAVMVAALYGGFSAGLLGTVLSCLTVLFVLPVFIDQPFIRDPADWLGVAVFFITCTMISGVAEAMRRAQARERHTNEQLETANIKLREEINERERAEDERDHFFNLSLDLLCIAGFDGYFKQVNSAWETTLGWTKAELLSKPYLEFIHPDDRHVTASEAGKNEGGERSIAFENRYRCKDGSYKWLSWMAMPSKEQTLIYATARDITERKREEEEKVKLNAELQAANKELEAFSYSVSHDLRAPLRHINGFVEMLKDHAGAQIDAKGEHYMNTIMKSAKRMGDLIDDLLVFSRMGKSEMRIGKIN